MKEARRYLLADFCYNPCLSLFSGRTIPARSKCEQKEPFFFICRVGIVLLSMMLKSFDTI